MQTSDTQWTLGTLIAFPIGLLIIAALIAVTVFTVRLRRREKAKRRGEVKEATFFVVMAATVTALAIAFTAAVMFPYKAEYHQWRPQHGAVESISERLVGDSEGIEQKFVVTFEGQAGQYGCSDTRCALVEPGDGLSLACKPTWQYGATDGIDCRFIDWAPAS